MMKAGVHEVHGVTRKDVTSTSNVSWSRRGTSGIVHVSKWGIYQKRINITNIKLYHTRYEKIRADKSVH